MVEKNSTESRVVKAKALIPNKTGRTILNHDLHDADDVEELSSSNRVENSSKIKYLPPSVIKDIEQKNVARKLAGLPPILTRVRHCLTCGAKFQSAGNRTCGCTSRVAGIIAGREII